MSPACIDKPEGIRDTLRDRRPLGSRRKGGSGPRVKERLPGEAARISSAPRWVVCEVSSFCRARAGSSGRATSASASVASGLALRRVVSRLALSETRSLSRPGRRGRPAPAEPEHLAVAGATPRACNCSQNSSCNPLRVPRRWNRLRAAAVAARADQPLSLPSLSSTRTIP